MIRLIQALNELSEDTRDPTRRWADRDLDGRVNASGSQPW